MPLESATESKTTPIYVSYSTMISALDALRNHGIPASGKIDKTIWESQSGSVRGQLILAFKFLGLIDADNRVQSALPPLVAATSPAERKPLLKKLIEEKYRNVIALGLTTISPGQLQEAFRKYGIDGSTVKSATRFFIKACTELDIPIAKRFSENVRSSGPRKKRSANGPKRADNSFLGNNSAPHRSDGTWDDRLLEKFPTFNPDWNEDLQAKWFEGFGRLMERKKPE